MLRDSHPPGLFLDIFFLIPLELFYTYTYSYSHSETHHDDRESPTLPITHILQEPYPDLEAFMASVKVLTEKLHPSIPSEEEYPVISSLMQDCFRFSPEDRPNFRQIYERLDNYLSVNVLKESNNSKPNNNTESSGQVDYTRSPVELYASTVSYNNVKTDTNYNTMQQPTTKK